MGFGKDRAATMDKYSQALDQWNTLFKKEVSEIPHQKKSGCEEFDSSLSWLTENAASVLDFGCASGTMLFFVQPVWHKSAYRY